MYLSKSSTLVPFRNCMSASPSIAESSTWNTESKSFTEVSDPFYSGMDRQMHFSSFYVKKQPPDYQDRYVVPEVIDQLLSANLHSRTIISFCCVILQKTAVQQGIQEFIAGACIGAFLSSLFYPMNVLKVAMQSTIGGPRQKILDVAHQVYEERGRKISNVYKGVSMNCTRAFFSWGIMNVAYEFLKKHMY